MKKASFRFAPFSVRQMQILRWWREKSPYHDYEGIIADGAIRSGKTLSMSLSFVMWSMETFDGEQFGMCGKTIGSLRRNVINGLLRILPLRGYHVQDKRSENLLIISRGGKVNYYYLFGGRDESSQNDIQGITLAGIFMDEVVLMPESFVNQATSRCSVDGSKMWFNCNPNSRRHFFKLQWINRYKEKRLLYLHFTMDDNLSLSERIKDRYKAMYIGTFYRRYILGEWVTAEGAIYDMFDEKNLFDDNDEEWTALMKSGFAKCRHFVTMDYGTTNPMVFLNVWDDGKNYWIYDEYYFDSKREQRQKTDGQYADDFERFVKFDKSLRVILDPSAESFRVELRSRGYHVTGADNSVMDGIRYTATLLARRKIRIHRSRCPDIQREFDAYVWDAKAAKNGEEKPIKENDHAMDALRYLVKTTVTRQRLSS